MLPWFQSMTTSYRLVRVDHLTAMSGHGYPKPCAACLSIWNIFFVANVLLYRCSSNFPIRLESLQSILYSDSRTQRAVLLRFTAQNEFWRKRLTKVKHEILFKFTQTWIAWRIAFRAKKPTSGIRNVDIRTTRVGSVGLSGKMSAWGLLIHIKFNCLMET